jgi:hypothetical protein
MLPATMVDHHANEQRHACAKDQTADHIAALEVGAKQGTRAAAGRPERRLENLGAGDGFGRIVRRDEVGEHRDEHEGHQDRQRQQRQIATDMQPIQRRERRLQGD